VLNDQACKKSVCPADKLRRRVADSGGLYFEVALDGSKRWFWRYRFEGKDKCLVLDGYPDVSLKEARGARDGAKKMQQGGVDPNSAGIATSSSVLVLLGQGSVLEPTLCSALVVHTGEERLALAGEAADRHHHGAHAARGAAGH
jgi:hypothetical protein